MAMHLWPPQGSEVMHHCLIQILFRNKDVVAHVLNPELAGAAAFPLFTSTALHVACSKQICTLRAMHKPENQKNCMGHIGND